MVLRGLCHQCHCALLYHGGSTRAGSCRSTEDSCQAELQQQGSCNRRRIFGEKTLNLYTQSTKTFSPCLDSQYEQSVDMLQPTSPDIRWVSTPFLPALNDRSGPLAPHPPGGPDSFMAVNITVPCFPSPGTGAPVHLCPLWHRAMMPSCGVAPCLASAQA